jgi:hypothetical protein
LFLGNIWENGNSISNGFWGEHMEGTAESLQLVEKLFDQAVKMKISQLARKNDPKLVFDLWAQIATNGESKAYLGDGTGIQI